MRSFTKFRILPDILSIIAVVALATVVYLCSRPETFHSLSHRKANAAVLMGHAGELVTREGALFASLVRAADEQSAVKLRQQLVDNERAFHDLASEFSSDLPEDTAAINDMVSQFDHLAAAGWRAAGIAPQSTPEERETLLDANFTKTEDDLRAGCESLEASLSANR
jgi:hypothetical protein